MSTVPSRRFGQIAAFAAAGLLLLVGNVWRDRAPREPLFPLAREAMRLGGEFAARRLEVSASASPAGLPEFAILRSDGDKGARLVVDATMPRVPLPWAGAAAARIEGVAIALAAFRSEAGFALVLVADAAAPGLLGHHGGHLENEWSRYDFQSGQRNLMVWRRGRRVFALVTDAPLDESATWVPPPETVRPRGAPPPDAVGPPDPSSWP